MFWYSVSQIIYRQAKKDLKISLSKNKKLSDIKINVVKELRKMSKNDLINEKYELEMAILHIELHSIDNFVSIRFPYYTLVLAIVVLIKGIDINQYMREILAGLTLMLISFRFTSDTQKDRIMYYKFKLSCIEKILG
ncbi:hypothetical protein [Clostridium sp. CF012]|uniref:hypothetical protein n=1 Tax=Clostridium sp. CF012 TaxID=2843319 RepID=UPI001C0C982D|nr:hypothetical protein [Clostridium sp. CF012]MBU3142250.1 hypothetical protein [Clostridium sp. CF012]